MLSPIFKQVGFKLKLELENQFELKISFFHVAAHRPVVGLLKIVFTFITNQKEICKTKVEKLCLLKLQESDLDYSVN